jgi:hypothetical protein
VAITTPDELLAAIATGITTFTQYRSVANQLAGGFTDLWLYQDIPTLMAIGDAPTTAAYPTKATKGSLRNFTNPTAPDLHYIGGISGIPVASNHTLYLVDRLAHMGGLNGTTLTAQTVGIDLRISSGNVSAARIGASDYSDLILAMEVFADIGATARNLSLNYRDAAGTDGQTTSLTNFIGGASPANRAGRLFPMAIPAGCSQLNNVTLSATTGTVGNFGIVVYRILEQVPLGIANAGVLYDWAQTFLSRVPDDACIQPIILSGNATTNTIYLAPTLIQG